VNLGFHPDLPMTAIVIVSIVNISLMVIAAFYRGHVTAESADSWRLKLGLAAVCFGLCSQVLYCLMLAVSIRGWVPPYSRNSYDHLQLSLSNLGFLLSVTAFVAALFGRGLQRGSGLWVAVTSGWLWGLSGLGAALRSMFSG
jgi:hypothetical protein